jgi:hypothetical protein
MPPHLEILEGCEEFSVNKKVKSNLFFWKKCTELLEIRYLILNVTVPLQYLITAILNRYYLLVL